MCTIIGSSRRDCVLMILFQLYGSRAGLFEGGLFWVGHYDPTPPPPPPPRKKNNFISEEELIQYKCNLIQFLSNISEIIPGQKADDMIL